MKTFSVIYYSALLTLFFLVGMNHGKAQSTPPTTKGWRMMKAIEKRIKPPAFPDRSFRITDFGAEADRNTDSKPAIMKAITQCAAEGGGKVVVPAGAYGCNGAIHLLSNVNLHIEKGAIIKFGTNPSDYLPLVKVRWEGTICYNYSPLVYAYQQKNIAVTGEGTLDGQTEGTWSLWKKDNEGKNQEATKPLIRKMGNDVVPETQRRFGEGFYLRPSLVEFFECENILLEGFTAKSSPFWTIHPVFCKNVTVRKLIIRQGTTNDDGIDPDSCADVLIENCDIDTDDDPIALKAGRDQDAWQRGCCENIIVRNCTLRSDVGNAFCIGSEMSGGVQNVFVENCKVSSTDNGLNFKCNLDRGGFIQNIWIRNIEISHCKRHTLLFQMDYHGYRGGNFAPDFQGFHLENITCEQGGKVGIRITGVAAKSIKAVNLRDINIKGAVQATEIRFLEELKHHKVRVNGKLLTVK
jgi:polygalacturonase